MFMHSRVNDTDNSQLSASFLAEAVIELPSLHSGIRI